MKEADLKLREPTAYFKLEKKTIWDCDVVACINIIPMMIRYR